MIAANGSSLIDLFRLRRILHAAGPGRRKLSLTCHIRPLLVFFMMSCAVSIYWHMDTVMFGFIKLIIEDCAKDPRFPALETAATNLSRWAPDSRDVLESSYIKEVSRYLGYCTDFLNAYNKYF